VALDRQSIEKRDFPVGRQGYDPAAVDQHLSSLADEVAELKRTARRRSDTLASSASDQVRAIVEAAETSAADIQRDAESDAKEIRDEANYEAQATKELATEQAREYVGKVSESTDTMLKRLDSMQAELDTLVDSLRNGSGRLSSDLKLLESNLTEVRGVVVPRPEFEPEESAAPAAAAAQPVAEAEAPAAESDTDETGGTDDTGTADSDGTATAATSSTSSSGNGGGATEDDAEGARLIALNMALNGTPREETAKYLEENFSLTDAGGLLDEVYASVEG
jgi:cell division septum initiation protein DivIVA